MPFRFIGVHAGEQCTQADNRTIQSQLALGRERDYGLDLQRRLDPAFVDDVEGSITGVRFPMPALAARYAT